MTRGLSRDQIGVNEEMVLTYGERIWELSTNVQIRRGDPVRNLDWEDIDIQRPGRGMADEEIANAIGLTRDQVLYIRMLLEHRRFRRDHYHRLYELGGGRRFRLERFTPHEHRSGFRDEALELRKALDFDPRRAGSYLRLGYWNADTVHGWLSDRAKEMPEHPHLVGRDGTLSFARVLDLATRLANALIAHGLRRGDVVASQLPNGVDFVLTYYAVVMIGAVFCPLPMAYRRDEMKQRLSAIAARAVICDEGTAEYDAPAALLEIAAETTSIENVIVAGRSGPENTLSLTELLEETDATSIEIQPVASDPAILCFTSGTSSPPKSVIHNYHTMLSNCRILASMYDLGPDDRIIVALPFAHAMGLGLINIALQGGAALLMHPDSDAQSFVDKIEQDRPTVAFLSPDLLAACRSSGLLTSGDFSSLRKATLWGTNCPPSLVRIFDDMLINGSVAQMWGATECLSVLHTPFDASPAIRSETLGTTTGSFAVRMLSADGDIMPAGEEGEMEVRGCSLFAGYMDDRSANRRFFSPDGWFRTGDLAVTDENGNVRITGRVDDVINRNGSKINTHDVETLLETHPGISQVAIVPLADNGSGDSACAIVHGVTGIALDLTAIHEFLRDNGVAESKWPDRLETVSEMPLTPTRKIMKHILIERIAR